MTSPATGGADRRPLAVRVAAGPKLFAPAEAARRLEGWWGDLPPEEAQPLREIAETMPQAGAILAGIAEASPYLFDLIRADGGRLIRLLQCEPDSHLAALIAKAVADVAAAPGPRAAGRRPLPKRQ